MNNKVNALYGLVAILVVWTFVNTHNIVGVPGQETTGMTDEKVTEIVNNLVGEIQHKEHQVSQEFKDTYFPNMFAEKRLLHGAGHVFEWHGELYTTDYKEETKQETNKDYRDWVLNSDDMDDYCASNYHDKCGVCDGKGETMWFADRDGDGLGDSTTFTKSCGEPLASK